MSCIWNDKKSTYFVEGRKPCKFGYVLTPADISKIGKKRIESWLEDETLIEKDTEETERDILFKKVKYLGLKPHYKAGVDKLNEMLKDHEDLKELKVEALELGIDLRDDVDYVELHDLVEDKKAKNESDKS